MPSKIAVKPTVCVCFASTVGTMLIVTMGSWPQVALAEASLQQVLDCAGANAPESTYLQAAKLEVVDQDVVQRTIEASFAVQKKSDKSHLNILVRDPPDIAGTAVLIRQGKDGSESMRMYLPALQKVRSVTGSMAGESLLGTDFSYTDINQLYGNLSIDNASLLPESEVAGYPTHAVKVDVPATDEMPGANLLAQFDQETCVVLEVSWFSEDGEVVKRLTGDRASLGQGDDRHWLSTYVMSNLKSGGHTTLTLGDPVFDDRITGTAFSPTTFYRYRNQAERPDQ